MRRTKDQDIATGVISLGLLANKLELQLSLEKFNRQKDKKLPIQMDPNVLMNWEKVLEEIIDFIQAPEKSSTSQTKASRFLCRAEYLDQIYTAAPANSRETLKELATYLQQIRNLIIKLSNKKRITSLQQKTLSDFAQSLANESIKEASRFYQEPHLTKNIGNITEIKTYA